MKKAYPLFGILAPLVYILAVILGGMLRNDYSHITHAISELTIQGAPNKNLLDFIFTVYNLMMFLFGFFAFIYLKQFSPKSVRIVMIMLAVIGFLGMLMYFFPMDARKAEITSRGIIHFTIAGLMSLLTILSTIMAGIGFRHMDGFERYSNYSIATAIFIFFTGGIAAFSAANKLFFMGLFERLTIVTFMLWVLVISIKLYNTHQKEFPL